MALKPTRALVQPLATIQNAVNVVPLGGTIAIRGGTYALTSNRDGGGHARGLADRPAAPDPSMSGTVRAQRAPRREVL